MASAADSVVGNLNRESLAVEADLSLPSLGVIRVLDLIGNQRGYPERVLMNLARGRLGNSFGLDRRSRGSAQVYPARATDAELKYRAV